jgi:preprotein translocase subunit SecG
MWKFASENGQEVPSNFKTIIRTQTGALSNIQIFGTLKRGSLQNLNWTTTLAHIFHLFIVVGLGYLHQQPQKLNLDAAPKEQTAIAHAWHCNFWTLMCFLICSNLSTNYCHPSDAILRFETPSWELQMLLHESVRDLYSILQLLQTY